MFRIMELDSENTREKYDREETEDRLLAQRFQTRKEAELELLDYVLYYNMGDIYYSNDASLLSFEAIKSRISFAGLRVVEIEEDPQLEISNFSTEEIQEVYERHVAAKRKRAEEWAERERIRDEGQYEELRKKLRKEN